MDLHHIAFCCKKLYEWFDTLLTRQWSSHSMTNKYFSKKVNFWLDDKTVPLKFASKN